jgi:four helix bundle protein
MNESRKPVRHFRDLEVYQNAFQAGLRVFELSRRFPSDERFALTDQIRRSSRSVCANIAEAWRKRRYTAAFVAKLNDAEGEAAETQVHIEFAFHHGYVLETEFRDIDEAYERVLGQLIRMIDHPEKWVIGAKGEGRK